MSSAMRNPDIARMAREGVQHAIDGTVVLADEIMKVPSKNYTDPERFKIECDRIFRRVPQMLALSRELPNLGDYKTLTVVGVPVLIVRGQDGVVRAFLNSCTHRGAAVALGERGNAKRFTCSYHGWTYTQTGALIGVASAEDFGLVDKSCMGLKALPAAERAGLIFVTLDPKSDIDLDDFLGGFVDMLELFRFNDLHVLSSRRLESPNWKLAVDGGIDNYHFPVLHKNTLARGGDYGNRVLCYTWGAHLRALNPDVRIKDLANVPESDWTDTQAMAGGWLLFPSVAIAVFNRGIASHHNAGRCIMIAQSMPGEEVGRAWHTLTFLTEHPPEDKEMMARAAAQFAALQQVIGDEDLATAFRQQKALETGLLDNVLFGRNEVANQYFHKWINSMLAA
jgi:carnitine monooxygenase subunit